MTTGIVAACLRADRVIVGAAFVAIATASATVAIDRYTDDIAAIAAGEIFAPRAAAPSSRVESPVELAAAQFGRDQYCLAEAMYHEARSEGVQGEKAVAEVILQRVRSRHYPNTICGVVYEGTQRGDRLCQFSYACDGSMGKAIEPGAWERSRRLASRIMAGTTKLVGQTNRAIAYHTVEVLPVWASGMLRTGQIGNHIFYRRAPLVRAGAEAEPALRSGMPRPDRMTVSFDPTLIPATSLEIKTKIEIDGAVGNGT